MLVENFVPWTDQWKAEGLVEGRVEGIRRVLQDMVVSRFGEDTARDLSRLVDPVASEDALAELCVRLLDCVTAQEPLARAARR